MKRLVICADGTWNKADAGADGKGVTNVARLRDAVAPKAPDGTVQKVFYHSGVGTEGSWLERMAAGAVGIGLSQNVKRFYSFLVDNYQPGDELFFFGFSRGAFTARSLAGFIRNVGILKKTAAMADEKVKAKAIDAAYDMYRDRASEKRPDGPVAVKFRAENSHPDTPIKCIGVWDTVGALGIPTGGPLGWYTRNKYGFHDVRLSSWVQNAFHALAIDEQRKPFAPTLWHVRESELASRKGKQVVEQVWFPGVHSNVGGGYPDSKLSSLALQWMLKRASDCGLALQHGVVFGLHGDALGKLENSMTAYYRPFGIHNRPVLDQTLVDEETKEKLHTFERVARDAFVRRSSHVPPKYAPQYDPSNLRHLVAAQEATVAVPV
jgi:uncharacterized protein (DUF2235 family)